MATETGPFWAADVLPPPGGQDHLGLGAVSSDRILPTLAPGINVQTIHPRYYSFYSYVLDEFWARDLPRNTNTLISFFRPREGLFSFACNMCDQPEHDATIRGAIVGSGKTRGPARTESAFDPRVNYMEQPLGGYGQYYGSVMQSLGLVARKGLPVDAPTPEGRALAAAYRDAVGETELVRDHFTGTLQRRVNRPVLEEFAREGCLCRLPHAHAHDLPLLQDLFLHEGDGAESRRETFRLLLDLSKTRTGGPVREADFRQLVYFRRLPDRAAFRPRSDLKAAALEWRLYQAWEYFAFVFNRLWGWLAREGLRLTDDGLTLLRVDDLWDHIRAQLDANQFGNALGIRVISLSSATPTRRFGDWLAGRVGTNAALDAPWDRHPALDEHVLYEWCQQPVDDPETLIAMLAILLLVRQRIGLPDRLAQLTPHQHILTAGGSDRIGMAGFFPQLSRRLMRDGSIHDDLCWLIRHVISQHERVAVGKLDRQDTFRFRTIGRDMRFFPLESRVDMSNSRYSALSAHIHELGLVSPLNKSRRTRTVAGTALLTTGDLPGGALATATRTLMGQGS